MWRGICWVFFTVAVSSAMAQEADSKAVFVDSAGSAVFRVPIVVPKGAGDVSPELTLEYKSQRGNGVEFHGSLEPGGYTVAGEACPGAPGIGQTRADPAALCRGPRGPGQGRRGIRCIPQPWAESRGCPGLRPQWRGCAAPLAAGVPALPGLARAVCGRGRPASGTGTADA